MKTPPCPGNPLARSASRRDFLHVGVISSLGLTLPTFLRQQRRSGPQALRSSQASRQSVINIFLPGGMAHQESFDPKPFAPSEYRGPYGSIETALPGIRFGEKVPQLAKMGGSIHRHPLHGPRRSRPRARHPQHVHRLPPLSRLAIPLRRLRHLPRTRPARKPPALRLHSAGAQRICQLRLPLLRLRPLRHRIRSFQQKLPSPRPQSSRGESAKNASTAAAPFSTPSMPISATWKTPIKLLPSTPFTITPTSSSLSQKAREAFDIKQETDKTRDFYGRHQRPANACFSPAAS